MIVNSRKPKHGCRLAALLGLPEPVTDLLQVCHDAGEPDLQQAGRTHRT